MPQGDTDFSKLVNLCLVKISSLISIPVYTFLKKNIRIFRFFTLLLGNKPSALYILQNCVTLFIGGNSKVKNQDSWKFHEFFMNTPKNSTSFLIDPWNFYMFLLQGIPRKSLYPQPLCYLCFDFLGGIAHSSVQSH